MRTKTKRKLRLAAACLACLAAGILIGSRFLRPRPPATAAPVSDAEAALDHVIPEIDWAAVPFDEAVARVSRLAGVPVAVDWKTMAANSLDPKAPVTFRARNATVSRAIEELCKTPSTPQVRLDFAANGDAIAVATLDELEKFVHVRTYDVRDLLAELMNDPQWNQPEQSLPLYPPQQPQQPQQPRQPSARAVEDLTRMVEELVAPDSWKEAGGVIGANRYLAGKLIVTQTWGNHRQIARLFAQLRSARRPAEPAGPSPGLMLWDARLGRFVSAPPDAGEIALRRKLPEVRLEGVPLSRAVADVCEQAHANLVADWVAVEQADQRPDAPVSLRLRDVTLRGALRAVLEQAGATDRVAFLPEGEHLLVTSREAAGRSLPTRMYDVRDWLRQAARDLPAPPAPPSTSPAGPRDLFSGDERPSIHPVDDLIDTITSIVEPESWAENGGRGRIRPFNGRLVVTQTWETHENLASFLGDLRADPARLHAAETTSSPPATGRAPATSQAACREGGRSEP